MMMNAYTVRLSSAGEIIHLATRPLSFLWLYINIVCSLNELPLSPIPPSRQHLTTKTSLSPSPQHWGISPLLLLQTALTRPGRLPTDGCRGGHYPALPGNPLEISSLLHPQTGPCLTGTPGLCPRPPPPPPHPPHLPHPPKSPVSEWTFEQVSGNSPIDTPSRWRCPPLWTRDQTRRRTTAPSVWTTSWSEEPQNTTH